MKKKLHQKAQKRKKRLAEKRRKRHDNSKPIFKTTKATYDMSDRITATNNGGIGIVHDMVNRLALPKLINDELPILARHNPYYESDHILNMAYNVLCNGYVLEDIKLLKSDEAYLNAMGAGRIPDPTTSGDFCRRFSDDDILRLMNIINKKRVEVWKTQDDSFFKIAFIDIDSIIVRTYGECKEGMDISYKGIWGYHPLLISLANSNEPLFIVNRPGNAHSNKGSGEWMDRAIELCQTAGFRKVLLRGDSAFPLTEKFDEWDNNGVKFVFSISAMPNLVESMDFFEESDWDILVRKIEKEFTRKRPERVKEKIIEDRGYKNLKVEKEDILEISYRPTKCTKEYRIVALRKTISEQRFGESVFENYRYFFYITNDNDLSMYDVICEANKRCNQENLNEQLQNGTCSLKAPLNSLLSNWAYMVITSVAWTLKSWLGLLFPVSLDNKEEDEKEKSRIVAMEFRTFINNFIKIPAQIVRSGRRLIYRLLAWKPKLDVFLKMVLIE